MEYVNKYAAFVALYPQGKVKVLEEKTVPVSNSVLQISRGLTRALTRGRRNVWTTTKNMKKKRNNVCSEKC